MRGALLTIVLLVVLSDSAAAQGPALPLLAPEPPPASEPPPETEAPAQPRQREQEPRGRRVLRPLALRRRLSNERTRSTWAYMVRSSWARRRPSRRGRRVRRLGLHTPDGTREVVLALEERQVGRGMWVRVRLPMRPNNTTGWVPRRALGRYRVVRTFLRVDRRRLRATLFRRGRVVWRAPIGIGEARWPTPRGRFYVRERLVPTDPDGLYGVFAFGLSAYSAVLTDWPRGGMIGIHGTNQPELLPGRVSHGCVRVENRRIARLRRLMPLGTPVQIR